VQERHLRRKQNLQRDIESALKSDVPLDQLQTHLLNRLGTDEIANLEEKRATVGRRPDAVQSHAAGGALP
jgi:hypothetical protein